MTRPSMRPIGQVEMFFVKAQAVAVRLISPLRLGETIYVRGQTTDFCERVTSLQINHVSVGEAPLGALVGIKVDTRCRKHDIVYKLST